MAKKKIEVIMPFFKPDPKVMAKMERTAAIQRMRNQTPEDRQADLRIKNLSVENQKTEE